MREYSQKLAAVLKAYLDSQGWKYSFDEEQGLFRYDMNLKSRLQSVRMLVRADTNGIMARGYPSLRADDENAMKVAEYLTYCNYGLRYGNFELDFSDGELVYKSPLYCGEDIPSVATVEYVVDLPLYMWEKYGNGLLAVIFGNASPKEEAEKADA